MSPTLHKYMAPTATSHAVNRDGEILQVFDGPRGGRYVRVRGRYVSLKTFACSVTGSDVRCKHLTTAQQARHTALWEQRAGQKWDVKPKPAYAPVSETVNRFGELLQVYVGLCGGRYVRIDGRYVSVKTFACSAMGQDPRCRRLLNPSAAYDRHVRGFLRIDG